MTRLLIGLTGGLYRFDLDAGGNPRPVLPGLQPMAFAMDLGEPARVYCATYNRGLWRSEDAGETWLPVGTPQGFFDGPTGGAIEPRETTFVSVDPAPQADGRHAVWVGTELSCLYRSTDHGDTFELMSALDLPSRTSWSFPPRPRTHHVQCIAHTSDGCMHLAIEAGSGSSAVPLRPCHSSHESRGHSDRCIAESAEGARAWRISSDAKRTSGWRTRNVSLATKV